MERFGHWLFLLFFMILVIAAGADWQGQFWSGALIILGIIALATVGLVFSVSLVSYAKKRGGGGEYQRLATYGISWKQLRRRKGKGR